MMSSQDISLDDHTKLEAAADNEVDVSTEKNASVSAKRTPEATAPCPRWGQTMTMIDNSRFIVYGGQTVDSDSVKALSDLYVYDLLEHKWTKPILNSDDSARTWHTANFLPERRLLLCFGGEVLDEKTGLIATDKVMALDTDIMLFYPPAVSGQAPSGRGGQASCVLPVTNDMVVFGGVRNGKWLNSVSILDTNRWRWSTLKALGDAPRPRSYHSVTAIGDDGTVGNRVIVFGGNDGSRCFNSVHVLEATTLGADQHRKTKWAWSHPKCNGEAPAPRTGHSATLLSDGSTILIYGGWDPNAEDENGDDVIFGDSFLLDTRNWTWRQGPKPRYHQSVSKSAANAGAERVGHSALLAPGPEGVQVLVFGGRLPENKFASDFQSLVVPF
ncbi:hypothetical protein ACHAWF_011837 [Thalassiosira exigua]